MSRRDDGGPAFPSHGSMGEVVCEGMTLRDYFAAKAMEGQLSAKTEDGYRRYDRWREEFAREAYRYADAMLRARGEP